MSNLLAERGENFLGQSPSQYVPREIDQDHIKSAIKIKVISISIWNRVVVGDPGG